MNYEMLFKPGLIGNLQIKNRLIMSPMATHLANDGCVTTEMAAYYEERAKGGVGAIVVEAALIQKKRQLPQRLHIGDDRYIPNLKILTDTIHKHGSKAIIELQYHRGRDDEAESLSPSQAAHPWKENITAREVSPGRLKNLIAEFGLAARRAKEAGFDGIMIHGAHGYLVCEFLSPLVNKRLDEYGGSLENRARLALELVSIAKQSTGNEFPVIFRLSASERLKGGFSPEDAISVCKMLALRGVDAIDVVSGFMDSYYWVIPCTRIPRGFNAAIAGTLRKHLNLPITVAGRITDPDLAEEILRHGKADFITLGRALIADPEFPKKAKDGHAHEIRRCIGCLDCHSPIYRKKKQGLSCAVNPVAGNESTFPINAGKNVKRILVVGGGPGGMELAFRAKQRGHEVTLFEKNNSLGGQLNLAAIPPHKKELLSLTSYYTTELKRLGVKVELNNEASVDSIVRFGAEVVVVASGSTPKLPNIPRIGLTHIITYRDALLQNVHIGKKVVLLGGGLIGCEVAEFLALKGKDVIIVEKLSEAAKDTSIFVKWPLLDSLKSKGVEILTGVRVKELVADGLILKDSKGENRLIKAHSVVVAIGAAPNRALLKGLVGKVPELYAVGDCVEPRRIWDAIHEGASIGSTI